MPLRAHGPDGRVPSVKIKNRIMRLFNYRNGGNIMPKLNSNFTNILNKLITDKNISEAEFRILCYLLMRAGN